MLIECVLRSDKSGFKIRLTPRVGNGNPLHYSCLENPMNRGAWWATVHGVARGGDLVTKPPPLLI